VHTNSRTSTHVVDFAGLAWIEARQTVCGIRGIDGALASLSRIALGLDGLLTLVVLA